MIMFLKKINGWLVLIILAFNSIAIADTIDNNVSLDIQVGTDDQGNPILLDLASVKGNEYLLYQNHDDGMTKKTLQADCSQGRLFSTRFSFYNSTGKLTSDDQTKREIFPQPGTAEATSMEIICRVADIHRGE